MWKILCVAILLVALFGEGLAQMPFPGSCPEVKIPDTFDLDKYMGIWFEYARYPVIFEVGRKCVCAHYKNACDGTVDVVNESINVLTGNPANVTGDAKVLAPGQLAVRFSKNQSQDKPNYQVLGTDYTSYSVVYSCTNLMSVANAKAMWILTRERVPKPETVEAAKKVIAANGLSLTFLMETSHEGCNNNCQPLDSPAGKFCGQTYTEAPSAAENAANAKKKNEF